MQEGKKKHWRQGAVEWLSLWVDGLQGESKRGRRKVFWKEGNFKKKEREREKF